MCDKFKDVKNGIKQAVNTTKLQAYKNKLLLVDNLKVLLRQNRKYKINTSVFSFALAK